MEIKYKPTFVAANKQYSLGEIPVMLGYAMEIVDLRPEIAEGKLLPGQLLRTLFGVTPEEYALKDKAESRELPELASKLRKEMPADRLIGYRVCDLRGAVVQSDVKPKTGASIDEGAFARRVRERQAVKSGPIDEQLLKCSRLQKLAAPKDAPEGVKNDWAAARAELGAALNKVEDLYVADDVLLKGRFPSAGFDGRLELFTTFERAERARVAIQKANVDTDLWQIRHIPGPAVDGFFRGCVDQGFFHFRVDNGFAAAELQLGDFRTDLPVENAALRGNMVREVEFGVRYEHFKKISAPEKNMNGALESALTLRNFVWRDLGNALVYALCITDEGSDAMLCSAAARSKADPTRRMQIVKGEKCVVLNEKDSDKRFVAAFTSEILAAAFAEKLPQTARPVLMTFDDLRQRVGNLTGLNLDCETLGYRVMKANFDQVAELRGKPPVIVRVRPKEQSEAASEAPKPAAEEDLGGLPDPDSVSLPTPDEPAPEESVPEKTDEAEPAPDDAFEKPQTDDPAPKKGFFRRLFGKSDK